MTWILPSGPLPEGGRIRSVLNLASAEEKAEAEREALRAYNRAYYHAKRKGKPRKAQTPAQKARRAERERLRYARRREHYQALARSYYWKRRNKNAEAARLRMAVKRSKA